MLASAPLLGFWDVPVLAVSWHTRVLTELVVLDTYRVKAGSPIPGNLWPWELSCDVSPNLPGASLAEDTSLTFERSLSLLPALLVCLARDPLRILLFDKGLDSGFIFALISGCGCHSQMRRGFVTQLWATCHSQSCIYIQLHIYNPVPIWKVFTKSRANPEHSMEVSSSQNTPPSKPQPPEGTEGTRI